MSSLRKSVALLVAAAVAMTSLVVLNPGTAYACSCGSVDPIDAVASAEVVFTGTATSNSGDDLAPVWQFEVDGVIKGEVTSQERVIGQDWGGGCGTDFAQYEQAIVVYAERTGDQLQARACMPTPTAQEFTALLDGITQPTGTGEPAAIVSGVYQASDFAVVDDQGQTLARAALGTGDGAVAHCPGTTTAAVVTTFPTPLLTLVDISTLAVIEQHPFDHRSFVSIAGDRVTCMDGGATVVVSAGYGPSTGSVQVSSITTIAGVTTTQNESFRIGRAITHPSGTVFLLPTRVGDPIETIAADSLKRILSSAIELPAGASIIDGDVSPDGSRLALLATLTGDDVVRDDTGATHVLILDVVDAMPVAESAEVVALVNPGTRIDTPEGAAKWIRWLDGSTWVIESETVSAKRVRIVADDGSQLVNNVEVAWGWGMTPLSAGILRSTNGGLQVVTNSGSTQPGDPAPVAGFGERLLWTAPLVDAPEFTPVAPAATELAILPVVNTGAEDDSATGVTPTGDIPNSDIPSGDIPSGDIPTSDIAVTSSSRELGWLIPVVSLAAFVAAGTLWFRSAPARRARPKPPKF